MSIPASFRSKLKEASPDRETANLVLRPSHRHSCIEGWTAADFQELGAGMERLAVFSEEKDDLTFAFYADAAELTADKDGRIILPEILTRHAGLAEAVVFVGMRDHFEIWDPEAAARRREEAHERARARGFTLPGRAA